MEVCAQPHVGDCVTNTHIQVGEAIHLAVEFEILADGKVRVKIGLMADHPNLTPDLYRLISNIQAPYPDTARRRSVDSG